MARPSRFEIEQSTAGPEITLRISGELDMNTSRTLTEHLDSHLQSKITELTLDLRDLSFMDSSGLRLLIELADRSRQCPWTLRLLAPTHEAAALVLRATGADTALPFDSTGAQ